MTTDAPPRHKIDREPYGIVYVEESGFKDTYGGPEGMVFLESHRLRPRGSESDTVVMFMHPIGGGAYLPLVTELARQGHHVIYCNSRYRGADYALIMEKVVLDLGAAIRDAKERFGYKRVVLGGWSGGGALSLFYQRQAREPSITETPAGDPLDLTSVELPAADAVLLLAAHPSRQRVLTDSMDPSLLDESNPDRRDPLLDLYSDENPDQPPYSDEFLTRFRAAQRARNDSITEWVRAQLADLRAAGRENEERGFVVHGTMANPAWVDPSVDPNDRVPGTSFLGDPRLVNNGPVGLARFSTLRSWLSQWSASATNADGLEAARFIGVPALVIENAADNACPPSYGAAMIEAVGHPDKQKVRIEGANHYYIGADQMEKVREAAALCSGWLVERGFAAVSA